MGRCLAYWAVLAVGAVIYAAGCSAPATSTAKPLGSGHPLPSWIGPGAKQEALRKQVDADAFPTAAQDGL
jgi:hypothetical protein